MPVNVRRFYTSVLLILIGNVAFTNAQTSPPKAASPKPQTAVIPVKTSTSAEIMRDRISKAKAFIAVRNYNAAIYELENIRRESSDAAVQGVTNVLLMNSYLEQGDYKKAQEFLAEAYELQKTAKPNASDLYNAVASQIVKGARTKVERYRSLGLAVSDRDLPLEAVNDVERMRETLEAVITQTKDIVKDKSKSDMAMPLLEEATNSRGALARDDYDARRWTDEIADSRERLMNSRSVITSAIDIPAVQPPVTTVAVNNSTPPAVVPAGTANSGTTPAGGPKIPEVTPQPTPAAVTSKASESFVASNTKPVVEEKKKADQPLKTQIVQSAPKQTPPAAAAQESKPESVTEASTTPMDVGSLIEYATRQASPVYPPAARSMRASGVVKVEVTIDESGEVAEVQKTSGHSLLQTAARDAVRKWKFKPFVRDGQAVRATGFVNFNFTL